MTRFFVFRRSTLVQGSSIAKKEACVTGSFLSETQKDQRSGAPHSSSLLRSSHGRCGGETGRLSRRDNVSPTSVLRSGLQHAQEASTGKATLLRITGIAIGVRGVPHCQNPGGVGAGDLLQYREARQRQELPWEHE